MIVDFAFGGKSLLEYNRDLVKELGHHYYFIKFEFDGELHFFRRGTHDPELVYRCTEHLEPEVAINLDEYRAFLKACYGIEIEDLTFRSLVGLYMRIWGKENLNVHRPLHAFPTQSGADCVNNLIKTFNRYSGISALMKELARRDEERSTLNRAFRTQLVPKIGKRAHRENEERIASIELEIGEIKANLAKFAINIAEIVDRDVLELKRQKDQVLATKLLVESKLARVQSNLQSNRRVAGKHFEGVVAFFPDVDIERLAEVEGFHSKLVGLLRSELKESERELLEQLERLRSEIAVIDARLGELLSSIDQPSFIVDRVYSLANNLHSARTENGLFELSERFNDDVKNLKSSLASAKLSILDTIQRQINDELHRITSLAYGANRKSPELTLRENSYSYEVNEDTGTGTAYAALIAFDLAVFLLTPLPALAHDSFLYKNIENDSVSRLFSLYSTTSKQSFVAIDEIEKYGRSTIELLTTSCVLKLSNDDVLFIKDWRTS